MVGALSPGRAAPEDLGKLLDVFVGAGFASESEARRDPAADIAQQQTRALLPFLFHVERQGASAVLHGAYDLGVRELASHFIAPDGGPADRGEHFNLLRLPPNRRFPEDGLEDCTRGRRRDDVVAVHLYLRNGRPNHKIEIIDVGEKSLQDMARIVTLLFDVDPWTLAVMRTDLAANIEGVSVSWFKDHSYVNRKQFSSRIEKSHEKELQFVGMGSAVAQTIYAGKRPCLIPIYNKLAEWRMQWHKHEIKCKRFNDHMEGLEMSAEQRYYGRLIPPTFAEYCSARGYQLHDGSMLTRIERQIGGNRVPPEYATLGSLRYAQDHQPFSGVQITCNEPIQNIDSPPPGVPIRDWLASIGLQTVKERLGSEQLARSLVLRHGKGNGKRILESLTESAPTKRPPLTMEEIQESYVSSTLLQTSPSSQGDVHLSPTYEYTKQIA